MVIDPLALEDVRRSDLPPSLWERPTYDVLTGIDGRSMRVRFDDGAAAAAFARKYRALLSSISPEREVICVRDGERVVFAGAAYARVWDGPLDAEAIAFLADAFAWWDFFVSAPEGLSLHAASVRWNDGAFAIAGDSTAGKSTTALACARAGMTLLSDERCVLRGGKVIPFPRAISLRAGGLALLRAESIRGSDPIGARLRAHPGAAWPNAGYDELFGAIPPPDRVPLRGLIVLTGFAAEPALQPIRVADIIPKIGRWLQSSACGFDRVAQLATVLRTTPCFGLTAGTPDATAHVIRKAMEAC